MPRRSEDSERVGLCCFVRSSNASKSSKDVGTVHEVGDVTGLVGVHAGRDVDEHQRAHQVGALVRDQQRGQAAEGHADERTRGSDELFERARHVNRVTGDRRGRIDRGIGVAVTGKVEGDQRVRCSASATVS
jgi:hypothetical protein